MEITVFDDQDSSSKPLENPHYNFIGATSGDKVSVVIIHPDSFAFKIVSLQIFSYNPRNKE